MKIKALKSFCGTVTMGVGEEKEVQDGTAYDLIAAGYATACVEDRQFDETLLKDAEKVDNSEGSENSAEPEESVKAEAPETAAKKTRAAAKK